MKISARKIAENISEARIIARSMRTFAEEPKWRATALK